jgi:NAD(P)-dependent dehydrogenase (short-subunit alcohol dehydrogenase family)
MSDSGRPTLLLTGAAEGFGASIVSTFAAAGHDIVGLSRSDRASAQLARLAGDGGGSYTHLACDISQPTEVVAALEPLADRVAVLVHNTNAFLSKAFEETTFEEFEHVWRVMCLGAFAVAHLVVPHMAARGSGTIILTGATAGTRGGAKFAAFASAKFALRGMAQSLSREFGPKGVHVAHVIIDGLIDEPQSERRFGSSQSPKMDPDALARTYLDLATQHASAWTHELDLRPFSERF